MTIKQFEGIEAWQIARQLAKEIYRELLQLPMRRKNNKKVMNLLLVNDHLTG